MYRGFNPTRALNQTRDIFQGAGQTATLKIFVSAWTGNAALGLGGGSGYQSRVITALFKDAALIQAENPSVGGLVASNMVQMTTKERVTRSDQIVWRGIVHRLDSDPVKEPIFGAWVSLIKRSEP
ncbi:MAG TPA: hypothetical protein VK003_09620 [Oceanobacillus sp.]|nr:hypothetical protein [Oceanobacillus sp.]